MRKFAANVGLIVVSTVLSLYAVETVLVLMSPVSYEQEWRCRRVGEPDKCTAALAAEKAFDARTKLEFMHDMKEHGREFVPSFAAPAVLDRTAEDGRDPLPFGGIADVDTVYCNESGEYVGFRSDEHGFRNPPGLYDEPPVAVVLGDSFARGYCVELDVAAHLRRLDGPTLNLGTDDTGPLAQLAVLREIAAPLRPRVVYWLFFEGNDLRDLEREWEREPLRRYLESDYRAGLFERQGEIDERLRDSFLGGTRGPAATRGVPGPVASFARFTRLGRLLRDATRTPRARAYPFDAERLRAVLAAARDETLSWDGELIFVYLPAWERFGDSDRANPHRDAILRLVEELDVPAVDVTARFESIPDPLPSLFPFGLRGHYTELGYQLTAYEIHKPRVKRMSSTVSPSGTPYHISSTIPAESTTTVTGTAGMRFMMADWL